jgi:mRNA-degrading endonuclease RelE of RelBE toxin-antitoxin system
MGALQIWSHTFCRCFDRLPPDLRESITVKVDEMGRRLATFPHERLTGRAEFKLRAGDYRILYEFDAALGRIHLLYVGHRREIYKRP